VTSRNNNRCPGGTSNRLNSKSIDRLRLLDCLSIIGKVRPFWILDFGFWMAWLMVG
jgi:hypothetical protein